MTTPRQPSGSAAPAPVTPAYVELLVNLMQLRNDGILSTAEYEAKKRKLLDG